MNNILRYQGYSAKVYFSAEDSVLYGKIEGITDLVTFESDSAEKIEEEFRCAVDDYLAFCAEVGKNPCKAYQGVFNVRISPELHRQLAVRAFQNDTTINREVENAIERYCSDSCLNSGFQGTISMKLPQEESTTASRYCEVKFKSSSEQNRTSSFLKKIWGNA